jgi:hypothetical protein
MTIIFPTITDEHVEQIAVYQQKWRSLATRTDRVVRPDCESAIHAVYQRLGLNYPTIQIVDSPVAAIEGLHNIVTESNYAPQDNLVRSFEAVLKKELRTKIFKEQTINCYPGRFTIKSIDELRKQLDYQYHSHVSASIWGPFNRVPTLSSVFLTQTWRYSQSYIAPEYWSPESFYLDWLFNCLHCDHDPELWSILESLLSSCGWIFPFETFCIVVDRPTHLHFDENRQLHAEAAPAIAFADGVEIYTYRGVKVHERYGKIQSKDWDPNWYLDEKDNRVRSILLQELDASKLDESWILFESDDNLRKVIVQKLDQEIQVLSDKQTQLIEPYRQKWRNIALKTDPINSEKATNAIYEFYESHPSTRAPIVLIASSPFVGRKLIKQQYGSQKPRRGHQQKFTVADPYSSRSRGSGLIDKFWSSLAVQLSTVVSKQLHDTLIIKRSWNLEPRQDWWRSVVWAQPEELSGWLSLFDFCISVLGCISDAELWETIQAVFTECGWFYPTDRFCVVCDRPRQIFVDDDDKLHREDGPAIIYTDGYRQHARHGLRPKQYFREH